MLFLVVNLLWAVLFFYFLLERLFVPALFLGFSVVAPFFFETDIVFNHLGMEQFILISRLLDLLLVAGVVLGVFLLKRKYKRQNDELRACPSPR